MEGFQQFFAQLTQPQADLLSSAATIFSALSVAILGPLFFHLFTAKGVRNFDETVKVFRVSAERVRDQSQGITDAMDRVRSDVNDFGVLIGSLQESLAKTQNTLVEQRPDETFGDGPSTGAGDNKTKVKTLWRQLQNLVEEAASAQSVNGNTRAKYARIDRRGYMTLVQSLMDDGNLGGDLASWREAYFLWCVAIRKDTITSDDDIASMLRLTRSLKRAVLIKKRETQSAPPAPRTPRTPRFPSAMKDLNGQNGLNGKTTGDGEQGSGPDNDEGDDPVPAN